MGKISNSSEIQIKIISESINIISVGNETVECEWEGKRYYFHISPQLKDFPEEVGKSVCSSFINHLKALLT